MDSYLDCVPKDGIHEAVREAKGEATAQLFDHRRKGEMASEAERLLKGSGWTKRGEIEGLFPLGPNKVRDILAPHILKRSGSHVQAGSAIQDTPDMVAQHYGRFLPQDESEIAARILNQVWEAARASVPSRRSSTGAGSAPVHISGMKQWHGSRSGVSFSD